MKYITIRMSGKTDNLFLKLIAGDEIMAMYSIQELLNRWQQGTLTVEQAIGQILQHLLALEKRRKPQKQPPKFAQSKKD